MTSAALQLESLLPAAMASLFRGPNEDDPLKNLSIGQIRLLRALLNGEQTATQLCSILAMSPSALTQMAGRLVTAGLISKQTGTGDRRVRRLDLSERGRELMTQRRKMRARRAEKILKSFSPEKTQQLIGLLEELAAIRHEHVDLAEVLV